MSKKNSIFSIFNNRKGKVLNVLKTDKDKNEYIMKRIINVSNSSNKVPTEIFREITFNIMNEVDEIISSTMGPFGSTNYVQPLRESGLAFFTKDGKENISNIAYPAGNPVALSVLSILKGVSYYVQNEVGDGTSSPVPITTALYRNIYNTFLTNKNVNMSPSGYAVILGELRDIFETNLWDNELYHKVLDVNDTEQSMKILKKIASIAANNNPTIGNTISELFTTKMKSPYPNVTIKDGYLKEDVIIKQSGFTFNSGWSHVQFATSSPGRSWEKENVRFLIFDGPLLGENDVKYLSAMVYGINTGRMLGTRKAILDSDNKPISPSPVIIIATEFDKEVTQWAINEVQGTLRTTWDNESKSDIPFRANLVLIKNDHDKLLQSSVNALDLTDLTGAQLINSNSKQLTFDNVIQGPTNFYQVLLGKGGLTGTAGKVEVLPNTMVVFDGGGDEELLASRVKELEQQLVEMQNSGQEHRLLTDIQIQNHKIRCDMLTHDMSVIMVGGEDERDRKSRKSIYDDVVRAIRSTIVSKGYILGGNLAVPHYIEHNRDLIVSELKERLISTNRNITLGSNKHNMDSIIHKMLDCVQHAMTAGYRAVLRNAGYNKNEIDSIIITCLEDPEELKIYNILSAKYDKLNDMDNSTLISPATIDSCIMKIGFNSVQQLVGSSFMLTMYTLDQDFHEYLTSEAARGNLRKYSLAGDEDIDY